MSNARNLANLMGTNTVIPQSKVNLSLAASDMPTGSVLQVLSDEISSPTGNLTTTYADVGLSISITPTSSSSKIWICMNTQGYVVQSGGFGARLLRGTTEIFAPAPTSSTGPLALYSSSGSLYAPVGFQYLDSPSTTSAVTYKIQARKYDGDAAQFLRDMSGTAKAYLTAWEIAG